VQVHEEPESIN
jgi:hypothetical protein